MDDQPVPLEKLGTLTIHGTPVVTNPAIQGYNSLPVTSATPTSPVNYSIDNSVVPGDAGGPGVLTSVIDFGYLVSFDAGIGGPTPANQWLDFNERAVKPSSPTSPHGDFKDWITDHGSLWDFNTVVTKPTTLTARWGVDSYVITFDSKGGSSVAAQTVEYGAKVTPPTAPTRTGYTFSGWNLNGKAYDFSSPVTGPVTLDATWKKIPEPEPEPKPQPVALTDVSSNKNSKHYTQFHSHIHWLADQGITRGWHIGGGKKEFRPKDDITRDAMAAFMYRFAGKPKTTPPTTSPFADVPKSSQFYKEITWLASAGISTGWTQPKGKPQYRPFDEISREAMAAFLYRLDRL